MARDRLDAEALIDEARAATSLETFDDDSYREGLDILIGDVNSGEERPEAGLERLCDDVVKALSQRLVVSDYLNQHPDLLDRPIERPVFVFGIPRTGTTLLSNLLAADPARRSPLTWEIDEPVPPATSATLKTDRRALARLEQEKAMLAARPEMGKYYRSSAIYPNEDVFIVAHDFKTLMWESKGKLPGYRDWIFSTDLTSAYEYHRKFLQVLQSKAPGVWNLKMPSHALFLETLLKVYPDARLVWTHRDPFTATGSFCSLLSLAQGAYQGYVDKKYLGQNCSWQAVQHAERAMDAREKIGHDRIVDVHYAELMDDPIATMRSLYQALGDDFTAEAEAGMRKWIGDNPQTKFGKHEYRLAEYGLTVDELRPRFERYLSNYDVAMEG